MIVVLTGRSSMLRRRQRLEEIARSRVLVREIEVAREARARNREKGDESLSRLEAYLTERTGNGPDR